MLLKGKQALVIGGGGAIGGAVSRAFAREGAEVHLAGRTLPKVEAVAAQIRASGGIAHAALVDALDESAVEACVEAVVRQAGRIDIVLNAVGILHVQGVPLAELSFSDYAHPIAAYTRTHFITAKAAARHMVRQGSGVIMSLSTPAAQRAFQGVLGFGVACGAIEALSRQLAGELGPSGIRVICLRPDAIPEAVPQSHSRAVFSEPARRAGTTIDAMLAEQARSGTLLKRLPTLSNVAEVAAFMASDGAGAMTGTVANLTCGSMVD
jgi:NAD(P)-dependent dehydrogenase (short-subunit alcohol dehydrogenase family)